MSRLKQALADKNYRILLLILAFGLVKGIVFISLVPMWEAPDEGAYFREIRMLVETHKIAGYTGLRITGHQQLYSFLASPFYAVGSIFGEMGSVFLIRFLGLLLMLVIGYLGFLTAKEIFPDSRFIQLGTPALLMLNPQFTFIMGSINGDVLLNVFFALTFWQGTQLALRGINVKRGLIFCLIIILGLQTKDRFWLAIYPLIALFILLALRAALLYLRQALKITPIKIIDYFIMPSLLIFFVTYNAVNFLLASRLTSFDVALRELGNPVFKETMFKHFWGYFSWLHIPMSANIYQAFTLFVTLCLIGLAVGLIRYLSSYKLSYSKDGNYPTINMTTPKIPNFMIRSIIIAYFSLSIYITMLATAHYQIYGAGAQGRYMFIVILPLFLILIFGLSRIIPKRLEWLGFGTFVVILFSLNLIALYNFIVPYYY